MLSSPTTLIAVLILPFSGALALAAVLRLIWGPGRGGRWAGLGVPLGFLAGWVFANGLTLVPAGRIDLIAPLVLGAMAVGGLLEALAPARRRLWLAVAALAVTGLGLWAAFGFPLGRPEGLFSDSERTVLILLKGLGLGMIWLLVLGRTLRHLGSALPVLALLGAFTAGLWGLAAVLNAPTLAGAALTLLAAVAGYGIIASALALPAGAVLVLGGSAAALGIVQALALARPGVAVSVGLAVLPLSLFAEATARRLPGSRGPRVAALWTFTLGLGPAVLAVILAYALR